MNKEQQALKRFKLIAKASRYVGIIMIILGLIGYYLSIYLRSLEQGSLANYILGVTIFAIITVVLFETLLISEQNYLILFRLAQIRGKVKNGEINRTGNKRKESGN